MNEQFRTTILIPGPWKSWKDFGPSLAGRGNYIHLGSPTMGILSKVKTEISFRAYLDPQWSQEDYSNQFAELFPKEAQDGLPLPIHSVFIIEAEGESFQQLEQLCDAISEVLKIGGYGVKIPNSGKTITQKEWEGYSFCPDTFFRIFVSVYDTGNGILTCGMSNFGQRDAFVPLTYDDEGIDFIVSYAWYIVNEQPTIKDRQTFSLSEDDPTFRIFEAEDDMREAEHPFYNPYGLWKVWPQEWIDE